LLTLSYSVTYWCTLSHSFARAPWLKKKLFAKSISLTIWINKFECFLTLVISIDYLGNNNRFTSAK